MFDWESNTTGSDLSLRTQEGPKKQLGSNWSTSYGDLITLLLVFFVILLSASKVNAVKFERIQNAFRGEASEQQHSVVKLLEELEGVLGKHGLADWVQIIQDDDGIMMVIKDNLLFESAQAKIARGNQKKFAPILSAFSELPPFYKFTIEGHTDDLPISTPEFPSNWHLSTARALSVLKLFTAYGFEEKRLSVHGFADQRPLAPNRDAEGRSLPVNQKRNRRVVIRVR